MGRSWQVLQVPLQQVLTQLLFRRSTITLIKDGGDYIYYSASNVHDNKDKHKAAYSPRAEALYTSFKTKNEV
jgi:hypothetical protein